MDKWIHIVEAPALALFDIEGEILLSPESCEKRRQLFYIQLLVSFYRYGSETIRSLIDKNASFLSEHQDLAVLSQLRYLIRKSEFETDQVDRILKSRQSTSQLLEAETDFVSAALFQLKGEFSKAENLYRQSSILFNAASATKKSLRALLSSIAAYSCAHPESRLFAEYLNVYRKAVAISENLTAATALLNISREFQRLGGLSIALEYASKSIELLNQSSLGSRELGLSLVHRAQLYFESKKINLALDDLYHAVLIAHAEVQSACQMLAEKYQIILNVNSSRQVLPTWKERIDERPVERPLAKLECILLSLIAEGPKTKHELMEALYGDVVDFDSRENRFKNLLSRLRSRFPDLISLSDQKYHLNDPLSQSYLRRAGSDT